ncbi:MAG: MBL fold metallo-hydrolase [Clostridiales bacterium]|nr:MBL fold metallo-hydrolase [Clostridiales bacterium]
MGKVYNITERINKKLYCLREVDSVNRYLILGNKRALLIDPGYGYVDFRSEIKGITDLPLVVACTHGDPDHTLGSYFFDEVYLHKADYKYLKRDFDTREMREITIDYRLKKLPGLENEMDINDYLGQTLDNVKFNFITQDHIFDLGDRLIEVIEIPGHSKGSVAFFDKKNKMLFTGDSVSYAEILYKGEQRASLKTFVQSLKKLRRLKACVEEIYPAHGPRPIPPSAIDDTLELIFDLLRNHEEDEKKQSMVGSTFKHTYKNTWILYTKEIVEEAIKDGLEAYDSCF